MENNVAPRCVSLLTELFLICRAYCTAWLSLISLAIIESLTCQQWKKNVEDVPLVEFMYFVFTRMPGESYCRWLRSLLLYLCYIFWVLINSLVCWLWNMVSRPGVSVCWQSCRTLRRWRHQWWSCCHCWERPAQSDTTPTTSTSWRLSANRWGEVQEKELNETSLNRG